MPSTNTRFPAALLALLLAGCAAPSTGSTPSAANSPSPAYPAASHSSTTAACVDPDIRGTIGSVRIADRDDVFGDLLIDGAADTTQQYRRAWVTITHETRIVEQISEHERAEVGFDALVVGTTVEACFVGPVAESDPVQAQAGGIVVMR